MKNDPPSMDFVAFSPLCTGGNHSTAFKGDSTGTIPGQLGV